MPTNDVALVLIVSLIVAAQFLRGD